MVTTAGKPLAEEPSQPQPGIQSPPLIQVMRGENTSLGRYDGDGNFIPDPRYRPNYARFGGSGISFSFGSLGRYQAYEHRSGRLIVGVGAKKVGVFVPELGSTILDYKKEYNLKNPDRMIWNMFETVPAFWTPERKKQFPRGLPKAQEPPKAGTPAGWEFIPFSKSHPDKPPKYARAIGDVVEFGHLSDEGEFVPDSDLPVVSRAGILGKVAYDPFAVPCYYTVPIPYGSGPRKEGLESAPERVYEFRSGRLIKGELHSTGNFVPELGSKVMDFKDYDPDRPPRIYNLPGTLRPVEKK